jgi:hypothetical protein
METIGASYTAILVPRWRRARPVAGRSDGLSFGWLRPERVFDLAITRAIAEPGSDKIGSLRTSRQPRRLASHCGASLNLKRRHLDERPRAIVGRATENATEPDRGTYDGNILPNTGII